VVRRLRRGRFDVSFRRPDACIFRFIARSILIAQHMSIPKCCYLGCDDEAHSKRVVPKRTTHLCWGGQLKVRLAVLISSAHVSSRVNCPARFHLGMWTHHAPRRPPMSVRMRILYVLLLLCSACVKRIAQGNAFFVRPSDFRSSFIFLDVDNAHV
jgi:hypothetical protein